ncbi:PSD1 and planctomycete cytochrome C domain-containing protein [Bremerella sp. P1]|uniref:PSD1 and planctomycete cytochrome C domain-containing protein n=1 Tax=Bremerella sp. P1 TaxID=3026424 RepID=UPI0023679341|nr:PSD1 and planctomycete cytochrome C domain-containing protein [Bremerella sp. P1]WDI40619.1 PSD1 and planctomycete cytochrome C domain-containing protein [Bremerella sp. P1]
MGQAEEKIDFRSQVQPILSDRCFHCHGPDAKNQESEFRLDSQENILADLGGYAGVVPGDLEASELHARIHSEDEFAKMPPPDSNRSLSEREKRILDLWIQQGAEYQRHWAFEVPQRPEVPDEPLKSSAWPEEVKARWSANPIDQFVAQRLIEEGLSPSPEADAATRLRRASLTLTGLLPPAELQEKVLADPSDSTYVEAVDTLIDSMAYAEHQSLRWLDAARYADTDGYQNDNERTNWPWRDWVIQAMHQNMPFDQFTIEQLAGDMLPNATDSQRLATAFNRNHRQNAEGGALADEFLVENVIDRVETTSTVWLGLTMGCARCHDHKYDPLSQREFYQFYGYFNNIGERGIGRGISANPTIKANSPLASVSPETIASRDEAQKALEVAKAGIPERMQRWLADYQGPQKEDSITWASATLKDAQLKGDGDLAIEGDGTIRYSGGNKASEIVYNITVQPKQKSLTALQIEALPDDAFAKPRQLAPSVNGNFVLTRLNVLRKGKPIALQSATASFEQDSYPVKNILDDKANTGWAVFGPDVKPEPVTAIIRFAEPVSLEGDESLTIELKFESQYANHAIGKAKIAFSDHADAGKITEEGLNADVQAALAKSAKERKPKELEVIRKYYESIDEPLLKAQRQLAKAEKQYRSEAGPEVSVMVMNERQGDDAPIYLLNRGQYNEPVKDEPLSRAVPAELFSGDPSAQPSNRLELAQWLVSRENPLTARVIVNRMWQDHFGVGLVKTVEDFGLQGEVPSHPELLDWLAVEFIESGWDMKAMHRLIVTSAAYRQSSVHRPELKQRDPENRLIARGPRYRADGYSIRDVALQASGLLSEKAGGPSVKPYQPTGLWSTVASSAGIRYKQDAGDSLYRKSMYTYWKRAVNPPRQTIFDAGSREVCTVRATRTNTPLQALVLMNDKTFLESARHLAKESLQAEAKDDRDRVASMYRLAIARPADEETLSILVDNLQFFRKHFADSPDEAKKLLSVGETPADSSLDPVEHAALTSVAHLILNLDEFVTIE